MSNRGIPQQWQPYFDAKQIAGYRELERKANIDYARARRVVIGEGTTSEAVQAVADALGITTAKVWELRGQPVPKPFMLPEQAGHLTRRERDAILAIVNSLLESKGALEPKTRAKSGKGAPVNVSVLRQGKPAAEGDEPPLDVDHVKNAARKTPPGHQKGQPDQGATSGDGNQEGPSVN